MSYSKMRTQNCKTFVSCDGHSKFEHKWWNRNLIKANFFFIKCRFNKRFWKAYDYEVNKKIHLLNIISHARAKDSDHEIPSWHSKMDPKLNFISEYKAKGTWRQNQWAGEPNETHDSQRRFIGLLKPLKSSKNKIRRKNNQTCNLECAMRKAIATN